MIRRKVVRVWQLSERIEILAGTSLFALIDDIASLLDDLGALTKAAGGKTVGVLGDDLALNAEQVSGVRADRELSVVWAVAKGSALNKLVIVPVSLLLSVVLPVVIAPLLMAGGAYLCFEGFEKIAHYFWGRAEPKEKVAKLKAFVDPKVDLVVLEQSKIKGAIRTDFILSAEIVVIALGTVNDAPFFMRALVIVAIAAGVTVGVYSLVAGIVKMDDIGLSLIRSTEKDGDKSSVKRAVGSGLLWLAPRLMQLLSVLGTLAMFLVGGGIVVHGVPILGELSHIAEQTALAIPSLGFILGSVASTLVHAFVGVLLGAVFVGLLASVRAVRDKGHSPS